LVFANCTLDPVRSGLVQSLNRPGGKVTGSTLPASLMDKQWAVGKRLKPKLRRMGVLADEEMMAGIPWVREEWRAVAASMKLEVVEVFFPRGAGFATVEAAIRRAKVEALDIWMSDTPWEKDLMRFLEREHIIGLWTFLVMQGGLAGVWPDTNQGWRIAIRIASQVLRGAKPAEIPMEMVTTIHLGINLKTAKRMSIEIPPDLLTEADVVIR
jgi:putative ABC transport system substrate-binding protein